MFWFKLPLSAENVANVESVPKSAVKAHASVSHNEALYVDDNSPTSGWCREFSATVRTSNCSLPDAPMP